MSHRRVCPACSRRYAGLIAPDCAVCCGIGSLGLGAAALAQAEPNAVARAIELYLEHKARAARAHPNRDHRGLLEAAVHELRTAGVLTSLSQPDTPARHRTHGALADSLAETAAARLSATLGARPTPATHAALSPVNTIPLAQARHHGAPFPHASANGHTAALCVAADPIDPLGPDTATLAGDRDRDEHRALVLAAACAQLATRKTRRKKKEAVA